MNALVKRGKMAKAYEGGQTVLVVIAFLIAMVAIVYALAVLQNGIGTHVKARIITVGATGYASAYPGEADIFLLVNGTGASTQVAVQNMSTTMAALNNTLQPYISRNVSNMKTISYAVSKPVNSTLYVASEGLEVTVPGIANATSALLASTSMANVYVSGVQAALTPAQTSVLRVEAVQLALQNATAQALAVSKSISLQNVSISGFYIHPFAELTGAELAAGAAPSSINSLFYGGLVGVTVSVSAQFAYS